MTAIGGYVADCGDQIAVAIGRIADSAHDEWRQIPLSFQGGGSERKM